MVIPSFVIFKMNYDNHIFFCIHLTFSLTMKELFSTQQWDYGGCLLLCVPVTSKPPSLLFTPLFSPLGGLCKSIYKGKFLLL